MRGTGSAKNSLGDHEPAAKSYFILYYGFEIRFIFYFILVQ